ncbi:hypothetical protein [Leucobacter triazinivorans]|uniref:Uncharacterized protein n=1 Tax=Leucobacter triazinivorans TaxID=1784719 RepID=A0A4P6KIN5_9MICO|nr:hypothetical protein [Leucobacter triazinivorans]QBE49868.1 hypothetical protein EVS81_14385 [Leucobacter triazinivorans]
MLRTTRWKNEYRQAERQGEIMTPDRIEPSAEASEADILDQLTAADPTDEDPDPAPLAAARQPVSEADWAEQQRPVPLDTELDADEADDADA